MKSKIQIHFFKNKEIDLKKTINQYIKEKTEIM